MKRTEALKSVREARETLLMSKEQLAKKLKISPPYLGGIEGGSLAHGISPRVETAIQKLLGDAALPVALVKEHNDKVRAYRRAHAKAAKKAKLNKKQTKMKQVLTKKVHLAPIKRRNQAKTAAPSTPIARQSMLPGMLDQLTNAKLGEMISEYVNKRLQERIDQRLDEIFGERKKA